MNNLKRLIQIGLSFFAIIATLPGAHAAAVKLDAYELVWLMPVLPAFTIIFFWIVIVMVGHFISTDSYKNPKAIAQARSFLNVFEAVFFVILAFFLVAGWFLNQYFRS